MINVKKISRQNRFSRFDVHRKQTDRLVAKYEFKDFTRIQIVAHGVVFIFALILSYFYFLFYLKQD